MNNLSRALIVVALIAAATVIGVAFITRDSDERAELPPVELAPASTPSGSAPAPASTPDLEDRPIPAAELARVEAAARRAAGGGAVVEIDRSDDVGEAYEVEIVTPDGELDVALDENLERVPNLRYDD